MIKLPEMTTNKNGVAWLAEEIKRLEQKEAMQKQLLKQLGQDTMQSLKPSSLVKSAIGSIASSKSRQHTILDTSLGIGAGLLARKWYVGVSKNIFKKLAGIVIQNLTTGLVAKKMPAVRDKISSLRSK